MSLKQGIMVGKFLQETGSNIAGTLEADREKRQYDQYSGMIRAGKNPEQASELKGKVNHRVLAKVLKDQHDLRMNDEQYKMQVMQNRAMKAAQAKQEVTEKIRTAYGLYQQAQKSGNQNFLAQSKQLIADAYEYFMDGVHMDYDPANDKFIRYTNDPETGEKVQRGEVPAGSPDDIFAFAQQVLESGEFEKRFFTHAMAEDEYNWQALQEAEDVVDKSGKRVGVLIKGRKLGKADWQFSDFGDKTMAWPEARKKGYMLKSQYQADQKHKADIAAKGRQGAKDRSARKEKVYKDIQTATGEFFEQRLTDMNPGAYYKDGRYVVEGVDDVGMPVEQQVDVSKAKKAAWAYQRGLEKLAEKHPDWDIIHLKREAQKEINAALEKQAERSKLEESLKTLDTMSMHKSSKGLPTKAEEEVPEEEPKKQSKQKTKAQPEATPIEQMKFQGAKSFKDWWEKLMYEKEQRMKEYSKHPSQRGKGIY